MAPHSSTLAWKTPWMEEPGRLQSMGSWRVGHDWATNTHSINIVTIFYLLTPFFGTKLQLAAAVTSVVSDSVWPHRRQPTRLPCTWGSPGKNTGVNCHFLLQCMKVKVKSLSRVRLFETPWTAAYQAPPSMGFSRQEYWSGVPLPSPIIILV